MAKFAPHRGKWKMRHFPVTVSTVLAEGSLVEFTSGQLAAADDGDTVVAGILVKAIAATDSDYATARSVPVMVPLDSNAEVMASGQSGFTTADIGVEYGISDAVTLDQTDTSGDIFRVLAVSNGGANVVGNLRIGGSL